MVYVQKYAKKFKTDTDANCMEHAEKRVRSVLKCFFNLVRLKRKEEFTIPILVLLISKSSPMKNKE